MERKIPIYFDSVTVSSPMEQISESNPNLGRLKVRVFTKYGNRNGSYITDNVADQIIQSAIKGDTPVIGFFDPGTNSWASHTGPTLANGYGYVESFLGWEPFTDTDGITRDYAVFSVILFTRYYEEAKKILGENQSMELNPETIKGDWAMIEGKEYFVYTKAETLGLCVIGQHEPCFSVSAFFSKNDDKYNTQLEKFSSMLSDLKTQVEEAEKNIKGGEQPMEDLEKNEVVVEEPKPATGEEFSKDPGDTETEEVITEEVKPEDTFNKEEEKIEETPAETQTSTEFEQLQIKYNELENNFNELQTKYDNLETQFNSFRETSDNEINTLRAQNTELQDSLKIYEAQVEQANEEKKENLINNYSKIVSAEEIDNVRANIKNFSYEEIESKLAISYAKKQMSDSKVDMVPLPEPQESTFASIMKKYKK